MLRNWIHTFIYQIKNNKLFTLLNILGLSIGIAGIIFSILYRNDERSYNAWNPEKDKVYEVVTHLSSGAIWPASVAGLGEALKNTGVDFNQYCYFTNWNRNMLVEYKGRKKVIHKLISTQANFFSFFPFPFVEGNAQSLHQDKNSVAISEKTAQLLFGKENPIGKTLIFNNSSDFFSPHARKEPHVVKAVYKIPGKSSIAPNILEFNYLEKALKENQNDWGNYNHSLLLKIDTPSKKSAIIKAANQLYYNNTTVKYAKEKGISVKNYVKENGVTTISLELLKDARLHSEVSGYPEGQGNYRLLMIMLGLSILILLLSIINYTNMATAHAIKRAKEVGIRKAIGATQSNIVWQLLFENTLIAFVSILLGLAIVKVSLPYYNDFLKKDLSLYQQPFYLQLFIIFLIIIALAGIFPAIYVAGFNVIKVLKGNFARSKKGIWLRNGMLVLQFAIASFFIIGAYIARQQVSYMAGMELGFKGAQVMQINGFPSGVTDEKNSIYHHYLTIKQELEKIKGVKEVSAGTFNFGYNSGCSSSFSYKSNVIQALNAAVDFNALSMLGIKMKEGRDLSHKFASDTIRSVLVNETALRMMGETHPIGKKFDWNDHKFTLIGVVKDFHLSGAQNEVPPMVFFHFKTVPWMQYNLDHIFVKIAPENMPETLAAIEKLWTTRVNTDYPFSYDFVDKEFARSYESYVDQKNMFYLLNVVVILIAIFGLYALASYSIERRMKEIAIRKTLGAQTTRLLRNLSKQYLIFCVIGFLIAAFPAYYLLNQWLENFAFRIYISFLPFVISFAVLLFLTLIVVISKAYRATQLNILKYLKYE